MSGITEQARKEANLRLLQRSCLREINDVVQTATHVVLYEFVCDGWQKRNIEGSMFLTQTPATYYLVILNRHSTENLIMEVAGTMQLQHQDPYLIFRERVGDATRIRGIWFHNADERIAMTAVLQGAIETLQAGGVPPPPTTTPAPAARPPPAASPSPRTPLPSASTPHAPRSSSHSLPSSSPEPSGDSSGTALEPLLASMAVSVAGATANGTPTPSRSGPSHASPSSPSSLAGGGGAGVALDKKSLQLALLSLIQDDRFLDLLHSQYLRVVHARVKKQQQPPPPPPSDNGTNG
jgi:mRNA-decapping enzyme 1B